MKEHFMCLSLPVPAKDYRKVEVNFFPLAGIPTKYGVRAPKSGNITSLKNSLAELLGHSAAQLVFFELYSHQMFELPDSKRLFDVRSNDTILVHETQPSSSHLVQMRIFNRKLSYSGDWVLFGFPFLVTFAEGSTNTQIIHIIYEKLRHYIQAKDLNFSILVSHYNGVDHGISLPKDDQNFKYEEGIVFVVNWEPEMVELVAKAKEHIVQHDSLKSQVDDEELVVPLLTCLDLFTAEEELSDNNSWFCSTCKVHVPSKKNFPYLHFRKFWCCT